MILLRLILYPVYIVFLLLFFLVMFLYASFYWLVTGSNVKTWIEMMEFK